MFNKNKSIVNVLIIAAMLILSVIGIISLINLFSYCDVYNTILENIESGYKITGLSISAIVFGIVIYGFLLSSIVLVIITIFSKNKSNKLKNIVLIMFCLVLVLSALLSLCYLFVNSSVAENLINDITNNTNQNSSMTIAEQVALIQPVLTSIFTAISGMFSNALLPCVLGIIINYNSVNKELGNNEDKIKEVNIE